MRRPRTFVLLAFASTRNWAARGVKSFGLLKMACIVFAFCVTAAMASHAQTSIPLFSFDGIDGGNPLGLIQASNGNFYGITSGGGANGEGTIFQITSTGRLTTLYSFCSQSNCTDGSNPVGLIQATDGNFYGTTQEGGNGSSCTHGPCGTVFKVTAAGILTTLYSFCSQPGCTDGAGPAAGLIQATDGNFYGTTAEGGTYGTGSVNSGTVFEITPGGTLTTLFSFDGTDGGWVTAGLIQGTDGNLYGTTNVGGAGSVEYGAGTVFKITPGGALTTLYSFCLETGCPDGSNPGGLIKATEGNFYGTTGFGTSNGAGTVFKITAEGALTTLHNFCSLPNCADGAGPDNLSQGQDGNFYGTTNVGPVTPHGTIFELTPAGTLTTLYKFCLLRNCGDGAFPSALVQATDGNFYGITARGGASSSESFQGNGTVFTFGPPAVRLSSTSLNWGQGQPLGETSGPQTVILTNTSPITLEISNVSTLGSFAVSSSTCGPTLVGDQKCKASITFTPTVLGEQTGTLTFTNSAPNSPQTVALSGTGVDPATLTPVSANYGNEAVGTASAAKVFTLTNHQNVRLSNIVISTTGDFAVLSTTCTTSLVAHETCAISVTFTPIETGTRTGKLSVSDSASNSPQTSSLIGTGAEPVTLTPVNAWYGDQAMSATSAAKVFTLTNNQNVTLSNIAISTTGDFAVLSTTCTTSLVAHETCAISVTFTPTETGTRTGKLSVSETASNSPQISGLQGTGE